MHHFGSPRIILDTNRPGSVRSAVASPAGSLSPASSLHSSPEGPQHLETASLLRPPFARMYDSPAFSPDRRLHDAKKQTVIGESELEAQEWLTPSRSGVASVDLSSMHGGLTGMLGRPSPAALDPANRQTSASSNLLSSKPGPGSTEDIVMRTLAKPSIAAQECALHAAQQADASHLHVFDSPAYASSDAGILPASSSARSSPKASALLAGKVPDPASRRSMRSVSNGLYQEQRPR